MGLARGWLTNRLLVLITVFIVGSTIADSVHAQSPTGGAIAELFSAAEAARLDFERHRDAAGVVFSTGFASIELESGSLVPVMTPDGRIVELVFAGEGRLTMEAPDQIEASQLELFTGSQTLDERFREAVFAVPQPEALLEAAPSAVPPGVAEAMEERHSAWRTSPEKRALKTELGGILSQIGEPGYENFFAGCFSGRELGQFSLYVDPLEGEQIKLGKFVRFDLEGEERRRVAAYLHRQHERGQLLDLEMNDLGRWDSWISTTLRTAEGQELRGSPGFQPTHYRIEASVDPKTSEVASKTRVELVLDRPNRRVVSLVLHRAMRVAAVRGMDSRGEIPFRQDGNSLFVFLPSTSEVGRRFTLEIEASGEFLVPGDGQNWALKDSLGWYPRRGALDRATYDVVLKCPRSFQMVGSGRVIDEQIEADWRWQRRRLSEPTFGFSFEIGNFVVGSIEAGEVEITVAIDGGFERQQAVRARDEILQTSASALTYFQRVFGRYPLEQLTIVTVPRQHSQALLGFVTLSSSMMIDFGAFGPLIGVQDRESVIAHELAHQWWGHTVGWKSYRDQWISEGMANYSALAWNNEFRAGNVVGPVTGWRQELTATLDDGRRIEGLGPLVLGERLLSSRSVGAYQAIIYRKGALVLGMLAQRLGSETFLAAMKVLIAEVGGTVISTEEFIATVERITRTDLSGFSRQFIYGTGLPEIFYDYEVEETPTGTWRIALSARQEAPVRWRFAIVEASDGELEVARVRVADVDVGLSEIVVPFRILLSRTSETAPRQAMSGSLMLVGAATEVSFEIPHRLYRIELDPEQQVLGRFFDRRLHPKRIKLTQAEERLADGDLEAAQRLLDAGLSARSPLASTDRLLDAHLYLRRASLQMDGHAVGDAERSAEFARSSFQQVKNNLPASEVRRFESALEILSARMDIEAGRFGVALARLRTGVLDLSDPASTEGFLWLAIAAHAVGEEAELAEALKVARKRGADVTPLEGPDLS